MISRTPSPRRNAAATNRRNRRSSLAMGVGRRAQRHTRLPSAPRWLDAGAPRRFPVLFVQAMDQAHGNVPRIGGLLQPGLRSALLGHHLELPTGYHGSVLYNPLQRTTGRDNSFRKRPRHRAHPAAGSGKRCPGCCANSRRKPASCSTSRRPDRPVGLEAAPRTGTRPSLKRHS
jgi:hypothetical protein